MRNYKQQESGLAGLASRGREHCAIIGDDLSKLSQEIIRFQLIADRASKGKMTDAEIKVLQGGALAPLREKLLALIPASNLGSDESWDLECWMNAIIDLFQAGNGKPFESR